MDEFYERIRSIDAWFTDFDDNERTLALTRIFPSFSATQLHWLATHLPGQNLHAFCPADCGDVLTVLPRMVVSIILSYLDPVSLANCCAVSRNWRAHVRGAQWLWRRHAESLPPHHCRSISQLPECWYAEYIRRRRLSDAWSSARCHVRTFDGHEGGVTCIACDSARIVSGSHDQTIRVWNRKTNSRLAVMTLTGHSGAVRALRLSSNRLISGSNDRTVKVWDLDMQPEWSMIGCKVTLLGHTDTVRAVEMLCTSGRQTVVSGSYDRTVRIWQLPSGDCLCVVDEHRSGRVLSLAFATPFLFSGTSGCVIEVWNLVSLDHDGVELALINLTTLSGHTDAVTAIAVANPTCLKSINGDSPLHLISGSLDTTIRVWTVMAIGWNSSVERKQRPRHQHPSLRIMVSCVALLSAHVGVIRCLSTSGARFASASDDKTVKVWTLAATTDSEPDNICHPIVSLQSHSDGVTCVDFTEHDLVSGSYDKTVKLWDFTACA